MLCSFCALVFSAGRRNYTKRVSINHQSPRFKHISLRIYHQLQHPLVNMAMQGNLTALGRRYLARSQARASIFVVARSTSSSSSKEAKPKSDEVTKAAEDQAAAKSKITWMRGYVGAHSNTDPPDAKFLAVATVVFGAGFYAWFIEPPEKAH
jgi:hypothetical protein